MDGSGISNESEGLRLGPSISSCTYHPTLRQTTSKSSMRKHHSRSRTTTGASLSHHASLSPIAVVPRLVPRNSRNARLSSGSTTTTPEGNESFAKTLLEKGSRLFRRRNSKEYSASLRTLQWVESSQDALSTREAKSFRGHHDLKNIKMNSTGNVCIRPRISEPYHFRHLTHTHANQFSKLEQASHNELLSEFSKIRASQSPRRELKGIKAENLQRQNGSLDGARPMPLSPTRSSHSTTPPLSPRRPSYHEPQSSPSSVGSAYYPRSIENFSQRSLRSYKFPLAPIRPPPRVSSKKITLAALVSRHESPTQPVRLGDVTGMKHESPPAYTNMRSSPKCTTLEWDGDSFDLSTTPHAVSTPDQSALTLRPGLFGTNTKKLVYIPGEDQKNHQDGDSACDSALVPSSRLRQAKSLPSVKSSPRHWSGTSSQAAVDSLVSSVSDDSSLVDSIVPFVGQSFDDIPLRPRLSRRISNALDVFDGCWEDDIDYCYEHAAEANCEFDWDHLSLKEQEADEPKTRTDLGDDLNHPTHQLTKIDRKVTKTDNEGAEPTTTEHHFPEHSLFENMPIRITIPDLDFSIPDLESSSRDSTKSSTISLGGPVTPSNSLLPPPRMEMSLESVKRSSSSDLTPANFFPGEFESHLATEELYQTFLSDEHRPEQQRPCHNGCSNIHLLGFQSTGSSHPSIGKASSQESFFPRSTAFSYRRHDSKSVSSLPELWHSQRNAIPADLLTPKTNGLADCLATTESFVDGSSQNVLRSTINQNLVREIAHQSMLRKAARLSGASVHQAKPLPLTPSTQIPSNDALPLAT